MKRWAYGSFKRERGNVLIETMVSALLVAMIFAIVIDMMLIVIKYQYRVKDDFIMYSILAGTYQVLNNMPDLITYDGGIYTSISHLNDGQWHKVILTNEDGNPNDILKITINGKTFITGAYAKVQSDVNYINSDGSVGGVITVKYLYVVNIYVTYGDYTISRTIRMFKTWRD
jgi:hypothetical protein